LSLKKGYGAAVDLTFNERERAFRDELRTWFAANVPSANGAGAEDDDREGEDVFVGRADFQRKLATAGLAAVHWPQEYGGRGATQTESAIFFEELGRSGAPLPANVLGLLLAGPTIMVWGTDAQKERYLQPILTAEEIWCQGFSEPDAGSDLANVKTRAVKDGDDWLITGQKVWTSGAQYSKWCMLLARSDTEVPRHQGLTYFIMDMEQEAVQVRPLRQITGSPEFNELFIEGARVPDENVLGGPGNGWKVAMTTLMNERAGLAFFFQVRMRQLLDRLVEEATRSGAIEDPVIADRVGELYMRAEVLQLTAYRGLTTIQKYGQPGPEGSLTKWMWADTNQRLTQLAVDIVGPEGLKAGDRWAYEMMRARGNSIEGGTTEVLKNIIAERVLGLPRLRPAAA